MCVRLLRSCAACAAHGFVRLSILYSMQFQSTKCQIPDILVTLLPTSRYCFPRNVNVVVDVLSETARSQLTALDVIACRAFGRAGGALGAPIDGGLWRAVMFHATGVFRSLCANAAA